MTFKSKQRFHHTVTRPCLNYSLNLNFKLRLARCLWTMSWLFSVVKCRLIRGTPTNSWVFLNPSSRCEMSRSDSWERAWVVVKSEGQPGDQGESVWITWSQRLVHRHWCFQDEQARYALQRSWKCCCSDTWRRQAKWFCRWIVVFVMCVHETSHVYSHEFAKSSCFDENLVR